MSFHEILWAEPNKGYGGLPIPIPKDRFIADALKNLKTSDSKEIDRIASDFVLEDREMLDAFAGRMATLAVRTGDVQHVRNGLFALELANRNRKISDVESGGLLYDACLKIGVDPRAEFRDFAGKATGITKQGVERMAQRGPLPMENTRFREGKDADGFRYVAVH